MAHSHQNNFSTNVTSNQIAGVTTTPLNSIPSAAAPFYIALDATNINGHYEVVDVTSKTATDILHAATTYAHTTAEVVAMVVPAEELDSFTSVSGSSATPAEIVPIGADSDIWLGIQGKGTGKIEVELPYGSADATSTSSSGAYTDVTGCSFSLTIKKTSHVQVFFGGSIQNNTAARHVDLRILRASSDLKTSNCHVTNSGTGCNVSIALVDQSLAAGTYTYKLQVAPGNGADTVVCNSGRLWALPIIA